MTTVTRLSCLVLVLGSAVLSVLPATAQPTPHSRDVPTPAEAHASSFRWSRLKDSKLGAADGSAAGRFEDLVLDRRTGKVFYAILRSSGGIGIGEKLYPVPAYDLKWQIEPAGLFVNRKAEQLKSAPELAKRDAYELAQHKRGAEIQQFYGEQGNTVADEGAWLSFASDLKGAEVRLGSETVGTIDDLIVSIPSQRASALVAADRNWMGAEAKLVVEFDKLTPTSDREFTAKLTKQQLQHLAALNLDDVQNLESAGVFKSDAELLASGTPSVTNQRTASSGTNAPISSAEVAPIAAVQTAILSGSNVAADAMRVQVRVESGRIVLSGTVRNEEAKAKIGQLAERAASGWVVENRLNAINR
jgi:sporulation protein YlmC with PRC-barrel domain